MVITPYLVLVIFQPVQHTKDDMFNVRENISRHEQKVRSSLLPLLPDFLQGSLMQPADVATPGEFQGSDHTTIRTLSFFFIMDSSAFILFVI